MYEEKYRTLVENATEGIFVVQDGHIAFFNNEALKLLECSAEEIASKPFGDFIYPDDRSLAIKRHKKRLNSEEVTSNYQVRIINGNGHILWTHVKSALITWEGRPAGMYLVRDVTDIKQAKEELRKSYEFSKTILNSTNDAVSVINVDDYTIAAANTVFLQQLGLKEEEAIGKICYELTHKRSTPCEGPDDICPLTETLSGRIHAVVEHIHRDINNQNVYVEVSTSPIRDNKGEITQVVHVSTNITERKKAENTIREHGASLNEAQRIAHLGNWDWDLINNTLTWSDELFRIFGMKPQEITPAIEKYLASIHPEDREMAKKSFQKAMSNKEDYTLEYRIVRHDGSERFVHDKSEIIADKDGKITRIRGTVFDITERKNAAEERERLILKLQESLAQIKTLKGLVPICASCKKIRDDRGYWNVLETYIEKHSDAEFSHGICPDCMKKLYPEYADKEN